MTLTEYLEKNNLTHEEFAEFLGCSRASVTRWVDGSRRPSARWARFIEVRTDGKVKAKDLRHLNAKGFGYRVHNALLTRGLTIRDAANHMAMSRNTLAEYIKDGNRPSTLHATRIKRYLGVSV